MIAKIYLSLFKLDGQLMSLRKSKNMGELKLNPWSKTRLINLFFLTAGS